MLNFYLFPSVIYTMPDNKLLSKFLRGDVFLTFHLLNKLREGVPQKAGLECRDEATSGINKVLLGGINGFHMGHQLVIRFVGDDTVQNKETFEGEVLFLQLSWRAGTETPLLELQGREPGSSTLLEDGSSITFSLPFGSYHDKQATAFPSSLLLNHHPPTGSQRLRTGCPRPKAQVNFQQHVEQRLTPSLEPSAQTGACRQLQKSLPLSSEEVPKKRCIISQLLDCYASINNIMNLKGMCFSQYDLLVAVRGCNNHGLIFEKVLQFMHSFNHLLKDL